MAVRSPRNVEIKHMIYIHCRHSNYENIRLKDLEVRTWDNQVYHMPMAKVTEL